MFAQGIVVLIILPLVEDSLYLYHTSDSSSVEFYDCISATNLPYCRRPSGPIVLHRDQSPWQCYHQGKPHSFTSLMQDNVSVSTVLHQWNSSLEKSEEYSRYRKQQQQQQSNQTLSNDEKYLCECKHPQSFGKYCEYLLPTGTTFNETIFWEIEMRTNHWVDMDMNSDIVCYTTLICNYGLLCLDWRDICNGVQNCMFGDDEENCDKLEFNECEDGEYRCANGMCIPDEYFLDGEYDCLDLTDEKERFDGTECAFQPASDECDDRICIRSQWSCGDGQCISNRLLFQLNPYSASCHSSRDQYYMCELNPFSKQWTLPNGKCYPYSSFSEYKEILVHNRTDSERCLYLIKCALSQALEKNCPCGWLFECARRLQNTCSSSIIQYPNGAILTPYTFPSIHDSSR